MNALRLLLGKSLRATFNVSRYTADQSAFRIAFTLLFSVALLAGLWGFFFQGFAFLTRLGGVGLMAVHRLFALFFLGMAAMLVLSSIITSYATFFRSAEIPFLLLRPIATGEVILYKYLESALLSSWAFFFIIVPFVGAYATHEGLSPLFAVWTFVFSIPFVLLCTGVGTCLTLAVMRWLPRGRYRVVALLVVLGLLAGVAWPGRGTDTVMLDEGNLFLVRLVPGLRLAMFPLWPSWWVAEGIMAMSREQLGRGLMLWGVLAANALLVMLIVENVGRAVFVSAWQKASTVSTRQKRRGRWLDRLEKGLGFLPADIRVLVMKDVRFFIRDPVQWTQFLFFFGILAIYFLNLRNLNYHVLAPHWRNLIAFLNVFSVSAVMCSFGSRFVFPQLSLEGQGFWILGMSPTSMAKVLLTKFGFTFCCLLAISLNLMYISVQMLDMPGLVKGSAMVIAVGMSAAVCGLSTGLGAIYIDLKQQNPAAIISSFGGTLNLVLSLSFMILTILPIGFSFHLYYMEVIGSSALYARLALALAWLMVLAFLAAGIPLWLGRRSLLAREY